MAGQRDPLLLVLRADGSLVVGEDSVSRRLPWQWSEWWASKGANDGVATFVVAHA